MRQVLRSGALGRPRGIGWRGRWEGGSGWGIHVYPWLIHVNVWQKPLQYCKVISLQLIKKKKAQVFFIGETWDKQETQKNWDLVWVLPLNTCLVLDKLLSFACLFSKALREGWLPYLISVKRYLLSHVWLFVIPWTVACQAPLSIEFSKQEYWSGLPCPSPGDLPDGGTGPSIYLLHFRQVLYHLRHQAIPHLIRGPQKITSLWKHI